MRKALAIVFFVLVAGGVAFYFFWKSGLTITLTQQQIQEQVESKFPVKKPLGPTGDLTLENPKVRLAEGSDRIGVSMDVRARQGPVSLGGAITISGSLAYDREAHAFFLQEARVDEISPAALEKFRPILSLAVSEKLKTTPLRGPKGDSMASRLVKSTLVEVTVKDGTVRAKFALK